jgi:CSLREA domain-containing protein
MFTAALGGAAPAQAAPAGLAFAVNTVADAPDANPGNQVCETANGNGVCTLRAALMEANGLPGADTVFLPANAQHYLLTGALTIDDDLTLTGAGAASTVINGNGLATQDRVLSINSSTVNISGVTIRNGRPSERGGGIFSYGSVLTLSGVVLNDNEATFGGGLFVVGGSATLISSTVTGNTAGAGGGIYKNDTGSGLTLIGSTVNDNHADGDLCGCSGGGGGISTVTGGTFVNSTISGNSTDSYGGGVEAYDTLHLYNVTITQNTAGIDGGGIWVYDELDPGSAVWLHNTIIARNYRGDSSQSDDCAGALASAGYNLLGNNQGCTGLTNGVNGDKVGTSANPLNPWLGPLANNGGPTQTHALFPGTDILPRSPAIDAGNPAGCIDAVGAVMPFDQRAGLRSLDGDHNGTARCDIGAYEYGVTHTVWVPVVTE